MTSANPQSGKISPFIRALAWILVVCSALGAAGMVFLLVTAKNSSDTKVAWQLLALIVLMTPLWAYAAIKGRAPRWFPTGLPKDGE
jgi:hypothetical protein